MFMEELVDATIPHFTIWLAEIQIIVQKDDRLVEAAEADFTMTPLF
jgi:hypothetical protein